MTRYSNRFSWQLHTNRLTQLLESKRRQGVALLDLTESNPTRAGLPYPAEQLQDAFRIGQSPGWLLYEPTAVGLPPAREAVATYYSARGLAVDAGRILLTASTSEAYSYLFKLLADPGDEVLVPRPSYPLFEFLAGLESLRPVHYLLTWHGEWRIDFDSLRAGIGPRTRAVVIVNPNNPTGSFLKADERVRLTEICAQHGLAIISDEVFSDFVFAGTDNRLVRSVAEETAVPAFIMSGLSKIAGLPQMKAGWIVLAGPEQIRQESLQRLELIADTYLSVSSPVQHALPRLMELSAPLRAAIQQRVSANLAHLTEALPVDCPARLLPAEGGWYATLELPRTRGEEQWALDLLEHDNILVQPGYFYDFEREAFLVLSLLTAPEIFRPGVARLLERIGQ